MLSSDTILVRDKGSFSKKGNENRSKPDYVSRLEALHFTSSSFSIVSSTDISNIKMDMHSEDIIIPEKHKRIYFSSIMEVEKTYSSNIKIDVAEGDTKDNIYYATASSDDGEFLVKKPSGYSISIVRSDNMSPSELPGGICHLDNKDFDCDGFNLKASHKLCFYLMLPSNIFDQVINDIYSGHNNIYLSIHVPLHADRIEDHAGLYGYSQNYIIDINERIFSTLSNISTSRKYEKSVILNKSEEYISRLSEVTKEQITLTNDYLIKIIDEINFQFVKSSERLKKISNLVKILIVIISFIFIILIIK